MSVLIKGMEMPKSCKECQVSFGYGNDVYCPFLFEPCDAIEDELMWKECPKEGKLADCPLVPVPTPHGRLIDADALIEELHPFVVFGSVDYGELKMVCKKMSAIIEAEGSEE